MSVLPIWAHSRGIDYGRDNFYPPKDNPLPDAFTSATPKAGEFIWIWKPRESLPPGRYFSSVEVNKRFDTSQHHGYSWSAANPPSSGRGAWP